MEATNIKIKNFKGIDDWDMDLKRITLLFGENGKGKTSLLEAFRSVLTGSVPVCAVRAGETEANVSLNFDTGDSLSINITDTGSSHYSCGKKITKKVATELREKILSLPVDVVETLLGSKHEVFSVKPEDFAKMGQWMLQRGEWNGQQLLNREWFDEAMSAQIIQSVGKGYDEETVAEMMATDDWQAGYGYQMWRCVTGAYRLDGAWGQFSVVCPDKNAVIVANCLSNNAPEVLKYIWKNVYNEL